MKERIVVVPGSFNPVTKAHIKMAETAAKAICAKKIIFVPAADKYVAAKGCKVIDGLERVKLIEQTAPTIITDIKVDVMTEEVTGFVDGLTYNTVNYIKDHNFADIFVCFGADVVPTFPSWCKGEELIKENDFIIIKRDSDEIDFPDELHRYRENFMFIPSVIPAGISSTKVREAAAKRVRELNRKKFEVKEEIIFSEFNDYLLTFIPPNLVNYLDIEDRRIVQLEEFVQVAEMLYEDIENKDKIYLELLHLIRSYKPDSNCKDFFRL